MNTCIDVSAMSRYHVFGVLGTLIDKIGLERDEIQMSLLKNILVSRCYLDEAVLNDTTSWDVIVMAHHYMGYKKYNLSRYFILYSSNPEKIMKAFDKEFHKEQDAFILGLLHNRANESGDIKVDNRHVRSLVERLPNEVKDHPYVQVMLYPASYSRRMKSGVQLPWSCRDKVIPNEEVLSIIPRFNEKSIKKKVDLLLHIRKANNRHDICELTGVTCYISWNRRHKSPLEFIIPYLSIRMLYSYVSSSKLLFNDHCTREYEKDNRSIILKALKISSHYRTYDPKKSHDIEILYVSFNVDYVRYVIGEIIKSDKIEELVQSISMYRLPNHRMKWLMCNDLVNNKLFRLLYQHNSIHWYYKKLYSIKSLGMYFSHLDS